MAPERQDTDPFLAPSTLWGPMPSKAAQPCNSRASRCVCLSAKSWPRTCSWRAGADGRPTGRSKSACLTLGLTVSNCCFSWRVAALSFGLAPRAPAWLARHEQVLGHLGPQLE